MTEIKIDLSDLLINDERDRLLSRLLEQIQKLGLTIEQYAPSNNKTVPQIKEEYRATAANTLKLELILQTIAEDRKLKADEKEIDKMIAAAGDEQLKKQLNTPAERAYLPADLQVTTDERYIAYIRESFDGQMSDMFKFENYLAAMSAWNETMGARLADFLNANPGFAGLTVAGSGHIIYNAGIPASLKARAPGARGLSFFMQGADACPAALPEADRGLADYVWYVRHTGRPERIKTVPLLLP